MILRVKQACKLAYSEFESLSHWVSCIVFYFEFGVFNLAYKLTVGKKKRKGVRGGNV